jgi:L-ascorbate metabolism protein UlaG (beta-lactamase superfamily)
MIKPRIVVPMHYNTLPDVKADAQLFKQAVGDNADVWVMQPGETREINQ